MSSLGKHIRGDRKVCNDVSTIIRDSGNFEETFRTANELRLAYPPLFNRLIF